MRVLVTGATGLIGNRVAHMLLEDGHEVHALVRSLQKAAPILAGVKLHSGDVTQPDSLSAPLTKIDWVFHAAGMPEQWQADEEVFDRVNAQGTQNVLEAARRSGVRRFVHTSTMDVFESLPGKPLVETRLAEAPKPTAYQRSKQAADRAVERARQAGLNAVQMNPSAVYGPSPVHVGLNSFFIKLLNKQIPMLPPGGVSLAFVDGVARAHILAAERGKDGERYLLSDAHVTNEELAREIAAQSDLAKIPRTAPIWAMKALVGASEPLAKRLGFTPLVAKGQLTFLLQNARVNADKAMAELGFQPTALADGVAKTVRFLRQNDLVP